MYKIYTRCIEIIHAVCIGIIQLYRNYTGILSGMAFANEGQLFFLTRATLAS